MRHDTEQWWQQAQADLASARILLSARRYDGVSWFAQQAAEKGLKALLIERRAGQLPRRTHDLEFLAAELGAYAVLQADVSALTSIFEQARYPDITGVAPVNSVTESDAQGHLTAAVRILEWIDNQF